MYFSGSLQQVAFCFNDVRLIGSDGLFAFCFVVCVFLTDCVLSGRVLSHVVYCCFYLIRI